jgi:hypothetical protein
VDQLLYEEIQGRRGHTHGYALGLSVACAAIDFLLHTLAEFGHGNQVRSAGPLCQHDAYRCRSDYRHFHLTPQPPNWEGRVRACLSRYLTACFVKHVQGGGWQRAGDERMIAKVREHRRGQVGGHRTGFGSHLHAVVMLQMGAVCLGDARRPAVVRGRGV